MKLEKKQEESLMKLRVCLNCKDGFYENLSGVFCDSCWKGLRIDSEEDVE